MNYLDATSPNYFLDRDHTPVEKLTYTCNTGWIYHTILFIQWIHGIRTEAPNDANPHSSIACAFLEVDSCAHRISADRYGSEGLMKPFS